MRNYLGIDYGKKRTGVALSFGKFGEPYCVLEHKDDLELIAKITGIIKEKKIDEIVVGVSEGEMSVKQREFANLLKRKSGKKVHLVDETLSSVEALDKAIKAGKSRKKRRNFLDAYSASLILERFFDYN